MDEKVRKYLEDFTPGLPGADEIYPINGNSTGSFTPEQINAAVTKAQELCNGVQAGKLGAKEEAEKWLEENGEALKTSAIKTGITKIILKVLAVIAALVIAIGATALNRNQGPIDPTNPPSTSDPANPDNNNNEEKPIVESDSGFFEGVRYDEDEIPHIEHRSDEEISETGITAQDVMNAYDQLATDIAKKLYDKKYYPPEMEDIFNNMRARFKCIQPPTYHYYDNNDDYVKFVAPFYGVNPNYESYHDWHSPSDDPYRFPAIPTTFTIEIFLDGVMFEEEVTGVGIEPKYFEQLMTAFNQQPFTVDEQTLNSMIGDFPYPDMFYSFRDQTAYPATIFNRDDILNATPAQQNIFYVMINQSIYPIVFDQKPLEQNQAEMGE